MIRITKQSDYGIVLLVHLARSGVRSRLSARDLATATQLPVPMVSKILKLLVRGGLVGSTRGVNGGYRLARPAREISIVTALDALEGPVGLTECIDSPGACGLETCCSVRSIWQHLNLRVRAALEAVSLDEMVAPPEPQHTMMSAPIASEDLQ